MKSKRNSKRRKALKSLKQIYSRKDLNRLLEIVWSAALSSPEAGTWSDNDRGRAFHMYQHLQNMT
jgi:hypothetical protein